ncbi:uncharacterized protein LOC130918842 [Corythoichthys intestinalis]|uniref:uncharacterized protein LOC130918842 n=1 Tax=Corythoichthys intestinalis TaxID=161448 RepID=UPI0025A655F8|nr:uncharacterized protein LOC130918842 [Corythoichthys intestinalis]
MNTPQVQSWKRTEASLAHVMPLLHLMPTMDSATQLVVIHHNTEGLFGHLDDIVSHHELLFADVLCFTETHFQQSVTAGNARLEGYTMFHRNRSASYSNCPDLVTKLGGGVAICVKKNHIVAKEIKYIQGETDLEFVVVKLDSPVNVLIAAVYRAPAHNLRSFLQNLGNLLCSLEVMDNQQILVCGDFNEDVFSDAHKPIFELFLSKGYKQLITPITTEKYTLLDLIFVSKPQCALHSGVLRTYYSYHNPVFCVLGDERTEKRQDLESKCHKCAFHTRVETSMTCLHSFITVPEDIKEKARHLFYPEAPLVTIQEAAAAKPTGSLLTLHGTVSSMRPTRMWRKRGDGAGPHEDLFPQSRMKKHKDNVVAGRSHKSFRKKNIQIHPPCWEN